MVIDIFGGGGSGNQRNLSARGRPGKDALELSKYFPNGTAALMRKHDMSSSYVLDSKNDCELTTDKKKWYISAVKDGNLEKPCLKLLGGSNPCELNEITNPGGAKRQYTMSFNGASVYHMSVDKNTSNNCCGFFCNNKPGTGIISTVLKVQKDRPQTLLYCCTPPAHPPPIPITILFAKLQLPATKYVYGEN